MVPTARQCSGHRCRRCLVDCCRVVRLRQEVLRELCQRIVSTLVLPFTHPLVLIQVVVAVFHQEGSHRTQDSLPLLGRKAGFRHLRRNAINLWQKISVSHAAHHATGPIGFGFARCN